MAASLAGGAALPEDALELVFARTDGVPLLVEEFTKAVVFAGGFDTRDLCEARALLEDLE